MIKNDHFLFDCLITNIFTNNSNVQAILDYYKSYMRLLVSHFHFKNSLLTMHLQWPEEFCTRVVSFVLKCFLFNKSTAKKWLAMRKTWCVLGVDATLVQRIFADLWINNHWQGEIDHNIFYMLLFVQKSRAIFGSVIAFVKNWGLVLV